MLSFKNKFRIYSGEYHVQFWSCSVHFGMDQKKEDRLQACVMNVGGIFVKDKIKYIFRKRKDFRIIYAPEIRNTSRL